MNAERGTRYRLEGLLDISQRGPVLKMDDGGVWALDFNKEPRQFFGCRVTIEGVRSGFDRIEVEWIGRAEA